MNAAVRTKAAVRARPSPARTGLLNRQCACGTHTVGGVSCSACSQAKSRMVQLAAAAGGMRLTDGLDDMVADALATPSEPMGGELRRFMERRLASTAAAPNQAVAASDTLAIGADDDAAEREARSNADRLGRVGGSAVRHDFSGVRLHAGPRAAASAAALGARAFTVGQDVVFGLGEFAPDKPDGLRLIAHELTHVGQQRSAAPAVSLLQRESFLRTVRDILFFIPSLFGAEIDYSDEELTEYLDGIVTNGRIDGGYYADNKARQIVKRWRAGNPKFVLDTNKKRLLIQEMLDGIVTGGDREGILSLLESASPDEAVVLAGPVNVDFASLLRHFDSGEYKSRLISWFVKTTTLHKDLVADQFVSWFIEANFEKPDRPFAETILRDILVAGPGLDFSDAAELKAEIFKRLRISQLLTESQSSENGFDYPGNVKDANGCDGYDPAQGGIHNARVNKAARDYWNPAVFDSVMYYYFTLTPEGRENGFAALTSLFTPQKSICDKTLIHCDYLVNVLQFRAYAESLGEKKFNALVKAGKIDMWLTYTGFPDPKQEGWQTSPKALGYQNVRVAKRADLLIGDHVVFYNHLAFDGLNVTKYNDWRLENAILVDKNDAGEDLFQGHGSGREVEHDMLKELLIAYEGLADPAIAITQGIDARQPDQEAKRQADYPWVAKAQGKWMVFDPAEDPPRKGQAYELKQVNPDNPEGEPLLPGLRDPTNLSQLGPVDRPIESAPGPAPRPP